MATKIRLQRHGKKRAAFYHVVIADERAKRDGKFIEKIGTYNPNTNPATIDLKFERALHWVQVGAQPTDTVRSILSYRGVMLKHHLDKGVAKGALTEAQATKKFEAWMKEKDTKIEGKKDSVAKAVSDATAAAFAIETEKKEAKAAAIAAKNVVVEEAPAEEAPAAEEVKAEEAPATEEVKAEEAPAAEEVKAEEAPAAEEVKAEEAPAAEEVKAEEAPAAEEVKAEEASKEEK